MKAFSATRRVYIDRLTNCINTTLSNLNCTTWADLATAAAKLSAKMKHLSKKYEKNDEINDLLRSVRRSELSIRALRRDEENITQLNEMSEMYETAYRTPDLYCGQERQKNDMDGYKKMTGHVQELQADHDSCVRKFLEKAMARLREFKKLIWRVKSLEEKG
ncbi:hypothetical protein IAQ61_003954 [Plenodomus lingam]|nr:hypothetical protein IAQ61_003954 [Plenodomus lingam]